MDGQRTSYRQSHWIYIPTLLVSLFTAEAALPAVPSRFTPTDPAQVLYSFEKSTDHEALTRARRAAGESAEQAAALAADYVLRARRAADPRYFGYAESLLRPWIVHDKATIPMRITWAYVQQHAHHFDAALETLAPVLAAPQPPAEAYLLRASIRVSRGDLLRARDDCRRLIAQASALVIAACAAQTATDPTSITRHQQILSQLLAIESNAGSVDERAWALGVLAELRQRMGAWQPAEQHLREALQLVPRDPYLGARLADLLLQHNRIDDVTTLIQSDTDDDGLLLRLALAEHRRNKHCRACSKLAARYEQLQRRGEQPHARDYARYLLHIVGDVHRALDVAQQNWHSQKESTDALVLIEAAAAANEAAAAEPVRTWQAQYNYHDAALEGLRQRLQFSEG